MLKKNIDENGNVCVSHPAANSEIDKRYSFSVVAYYGAEWESKYTSQEFSSWEECRKFLVNCNRYGTYHLASGLVFDFATGLKQFEEGITKIGDDEQGWHYHLRIAKKQKNQAA